MSQTNQNDATLRFEEIGKVVDRIVEKNEAFFQLISTPGLTRDEQMALLNTAIPSHEVTAECVERDCPCQRTAP